MHGPKRVGIRVSDPDPGCVCELHPRRMQRTPGIRVDEGYV